MVKGIYEKYATRIFSAQFDLEAFDPTHPLLKLVNVDLKNNRLTYIFKGTIYNFENIDDALLLYVGDLEKQLELNLEQQDIGTE